MKTIILVGKNGQLCNRLFMIAHVLSFAIDNNCKVVIANFDDYLKYFNKENFNKSWITVLNGIAAYSLAVTGLILKKLRIVPRYKSFEIIKKSSNKYIFVNEWNLLYTPQIENHRSKISDIFKFREEYLKKISISKTEEFKIAIGVHIRRGDYKVWKDGKYYYSLQFYADLIKFYIINYPSARIIICSNEDIETSIPANNNIVFSNSNFISDLWILAQCDYIIGPPSTFNAWASFSGNKPLYTIKSKEELPPLDNFKIFDGNLLNLTN